jgi:hypothetical protein
VKTSSGQLLRELERCRRCRPSCLFCRHELGRTLRGVPRSCLGLEGTSERKVTLARDGVRSERLRFSRPGLSVVSNAK